MLIVKRRLKVCILHVRGGKSSRVKKNCSVVVVVRARLDNASREQIACQQNFACCSSVVDAYGSILRSAVWWSNASVATLMGKVDNLTIDISSTTYSPKACCPSKTLVNHQMVVTQ